METIISYSAAAIIGIALLYGAARAIYGRQIEDSEWPNARQDDPADGMPIEQRFRNFEGG